MDTGSAKRVVVDAMSMLPGASRMVGGHPLAGSEHSGPAFADRALFHGRTFFLCATPESTAEARERADGLVRGLGAQPLWVEAADHDRMLAATSHLPQIVASLLAASVESPGPYAGPAFRDMTRLAGSDPSIWRDILLANAHDVVRAGRSYGQALSSLLDAIEAEDVASIEGAILSGQRARELLEAAT
jgi:prephenate dehydrogenase